MKSRILAVLFAAMLTAGTLVGCGSKAAEDAETKTEDTKEDTANDAEKTWIRKIQKRKILPRQIQQ